MVDKLNILIVDDERDFSSTIKGVLEDEFGARIITHLANSEETAMQKFNELCAVGILNGIATVDGLNGGGAHFIYRAKKIETNWLFLGMSGSGSVYKADGDVGKGGDWDEKLIKEIQKRLD